MINLSDYLKNEFGEKVYRLSLTSGCTCPNRDGLISTGGCTFCSEGGSGEFAANLRPINEQISEAKKWIQNKTNAKKFIAYFQSFTNTYGDPKTLEKLYREALSEEDIVALSIGTRPDCLGGEILKMLENLRNSEFPVSSNLEEFANKSTNENKDEIGNEGLKKTEESTEIKMVKKPVWIELGLQTIHENTAKNI
ncbi:MAG: hypothetical protein K6D02_09250, partial [Lachnospiraceae bacterium]|nr:hypothetical protein [Lachnospiraceae bacterium]